MLKIYELYEINVILNRKELKMRTFIIGAGFSYAVAQAPLMYQLWEFFESAYEEEKSKKESPIRMKLFKELENFIDEIEKSAKERFKEKKNIYAGVRQNLEYLLTLMDIHSKYGAKFEFEKPNADVTPYSVIPLPYTSEAQLTRLKSAISTYLYIIFQNLEENELLYKFTELIKEKDCFINFNYDLLLEKGLWNEKLWSPLEGYVGVDEFKYQSDYKDLKNANLKSKTRIFKMHGSLMFYSNGLINNDKNIKLLLDNRENWNFFFKEFKEVLSREPEKPTGEISAKISKGYLGKYNPHWIFPSFVKPFDSNTFYKIWRSAFNQIRNTSELHIIGYSFRPEDSNGQLLLLNLPKKCKVILVDPNKKVKPEFGK